MIARHQQSFIAASCTMRTRPTRKRFEVSMAGISTRRRLPSSQSRAGFVVPLAEVIVMFDRKRMT